jgi:hypothetical protein
VKRPDISDPAKSIRKMLKAHVFIPFEEIKNKENPEKKFSLTEII